MLISRVWSSAHSIILRKERPHSEKMAKNRLEEPEFRLLASVYAELGPDAVGAVCEHVAVGLP